MSRDAFFLEPSSPFRLDLTVWTLRRRPDNVVDRWDGRTYRRIVPLSSGLVDTAVTQVGPPETPRLQVSVEGQSLRSSVKSEVTSILERLLGLRIDLAGFYRLAALEKELGQLACRFQGMKPPRYATVFESVVVGIASQQVTRTVSILVLNRLTESYGAAFHEGDELAHAFPRPEDLADLRSEELRPLGFSRQKERAIAELARSVLEGSLDLEGLAQLRDEEAIERLCSLRGVGRWTAEYVLLRGLGRTQIFPGDDVGARNNLKRWLGLEQPMDYEAVRRTLERWHPYAGLIYFHMLLDRLSEEGVTEASQPQTGDQTQKKQQPKNTPVKRNFTIGDHVEWNSEAGGVRGTIRKKLGCPTKFTTYTVRASKEEPQYLIKSDKTDHLAMHKGAALKKIRNVAEHSPKVKDRKELR
jgi:DNA-3-methyladenine glycosylase II